MSRAVTRQSINEDWEDAFMAVLAEIASWALKAIDWRAVSHYRMGGYSPVDAATEYVEHRLREDLSI